jgi:hypothetical protein
MPLALDWITHSWELRKSNNKIRIITGFILGLGVALLRFSLATFKSKIILYVSLSLGIIILGMLGKVIRKQRTLIIEEAITSRRRKFIK